MGKLTERRHVPEMKRNREFIVRAARPGENFYTWRGRLRTLHGFDRRLVLNTYRGEELLASAIVSSNEAGPDDPSDTFTFADSEFEAEGPYFGDPDLIGDTAYLHLQSLYVRRDWRRRGVGNALIEALKGIGLPTFCRFRLAFLRAVFERYRTDSKANEMTAFEWTFNGEGGSLACAMSLAMDHALPPTYASIFSRRPIEAEIVLSDGSAHVEPRGVDGLEEVDDEALAVGIEGERESDIVHYPAEAWNDDDGSWLPREVESELGHWLEPDRSGLAISKLALVDAELPAPGETAAARFRVVLRADIERPELFELRARYRRYLRTFDSSWDDAGIGSAVREIARLKYVKIESVHVS